MWTRDYDCEARLRLVKNSPWKEYRVEGIWKSLGILERDGTISHHGYMTNWKPANKYAEALFK